MAYISILILPKNCSQQYPHISATPAPKPGTFWRRNAAFGIQQEVCLPEYVQEHAVKTGLISV